MVKLRLKRTGKRNAPCYRVIAADSRSPRDGRFIETVGLYDPRLGVENLKMDRVDYWLSVGAQPTDTVKDIIRRAKTGDTVKNNKARKKEVEAKAKAEEAAKAAEEAKKAEEEAAKAAAEEAAAAEAAAAEAAAAEEAAAEAPAEEEKSED